MKLLALALLLACAALAQYSPPSTVCASFGVSFTPACSSVPANNPTLVAHTAAGSTGANSVTTSAIDTTGAKLVIVYVARDNGSGVGLTDSVSSSFTCLTPHHPTFPQNAVLCYVLNPTTNSSYTVSYAGTGSAPVLAVQAWKNVSTIGPENGNTATSSTTVQTGSVTPGGSPAVIITALGGVFTSVPSIDSSFTISDTVTFSAGNHYGASMAYKVISTASNPTWTYAPSGDAGTSIVTFN